MKFFSLRRPSLLIPALGILFVIIPSAVPAQTKGWQTATADELKQTAPKVEPDPDAEALLWDVYVTDEEEKGTGDLQTILSHYLRIKIYNDRGREAFSKIDIPYGKIEGVGLDIRVKNIAARTTKADG